VTAGDVPELGGQGARVRPLAVASAIGAAIGTTLSLSVAVVSALGVALFGPVDWVAAAIVGAGALVGGRVGVGLARRLPEPVLRGAVIALGVTVAVALLV
jgi:uncharacterized membrane protein YfcA